VRVRFTGLQVWWVQRVSALYMLLFVIFLLCSSSAAGLSDVRDLIVDKTQFFKQYHSIEPYLVNPEPPPERECLQSPAESDKLNGAYTCILCDCCIGQCPSYWWIPDKFVGPAGLIQAHRFISDSRDRATTERLDDLNNDPHRLFRCRTIVNCAEVCPKGLEPFQAIECIRLKIAGDNDHTGGLDVH